MLYNDKKATFEELLDKGKTVSIHRNLQMLFTEMFKVKIGESPSIMHEMFYIDYSNNYNLRKNSREINPDNPKTVYYVTETISLLRIILPDEYKKFKSISFMLYVFLRFVCNQSGLEILL